MPEDDVALLRQFVDGNREAFEALHRRHHREVHGWILRIVRDTAAADDALGVPLGTVKSRLFRATRALRDDLQRRGIQPRPTTSSDDSSGRRCRQSHPRR